MNDKQLLLYKSVQNPGTFISDYISGPMNRDKTLSAVLEKRAKYAAYHYHIFKIFFWTGNNIIITVCTGGATSTNVTTTFIVKRKKTGLKLLTSQS